MKTAVVKPLAVNVVLLLALKFAGKIIKNLRLARARLFLVEEKTVPTIICGYCEYVGQGETMEARWDDARKHELIEHPDEVKDDDGLTDKEIADELDTLKKH
jgi:hypothetical protein